MSFSKQQPSPAEAVLLEEYPQGAITALYTLETHAAERTSFAQGFSASREALTAWLSAATSGSDDLRVTVIVPDETRPLPPDSVLPPVLEAIAQSTADAIHVHILVALGLHAPSGTAFVGQLEHAIAPFQERLTVEWSFHDAIKTDEDGRAINIKAVDRAQGGWTDRIVSIGLVEPHQYAGFSGGSKGITIGCGAATTISKLHGLDILRHEGVAIGNISNNLFREALGTIALEHAAPTFSIGLVPAAHGEGFSGVFAGDTQQTFLDAVVLARHTLMAPTEQLFDFAIIGVPPTKSSNFYQASRALTYLALHPTPCVREGGTLVIQATCPDGFGAGRGEQTFRRTLSRGTPRLMREYAGEIKPLEPLQGGAQRAYVLAKALSRFDCVLIGAPDLPEASNAGLRQVSGLDHAGLAGVGLVIDDPFVAMPYHKPTR